MAVGKYRTIYINSNGPVVTPAFKQVADQFIGGYEALTLDAQSLVIKRKVDFGVPGVVSIQYSASRWYAQARNPGQNPLKGVFLAR